MKAGDLIKWVEYDCFKLLFFENIGVVMRKGKSLAYDRTIFVLDMSGKEVILSEDCESIEVLK